MTSKQGSTTTWRPAVPAPEAEEAEVQAGQWEARTTCPAPPPDRQGFQGAPCMAHTACFAPMKLICAKKAPESAGSCRKVSCKSDPDCKGATDFPARCSRGSCARKECYEDSACPRGYACYEGQCKKVICPPSSSRLLQAPPPQDLGSCKYDCDCSQCDLTQCFRVASQPSSLPPPCPLAGPLLLPGRPRQVHRLPRPGGRPQPCQEWG